MSDLATVIRESVEKLGEGASISFSVVKDGDAKNLVTTFDAPWPEDTPVNSTAPTMRAEDTLHMNALLDLGKVDVYLREKIQRVTIQLVEYGRTGRVPDAGF